MPARLPGLIGILLLSGCAQLPSQAPLAGTAWDVGLQRAMPVEQVLQQATAADILLLGETHDNPDHHVIEAAIVDSFARRKAAVLVMEQYDIEQQPALDAVARDAGDDVARLDALRRLMGAGWDWPAYRPLLATALRHRLPIIAANASRATLRQVSKEGFATLGPGQSARLALDNGWSTGQQTLLDQEIADGHCGILPAGAITAIALAQRARDALMADRILAQSAVPIIAIFGRGHVRQDLAVPIYLKQRAGNRHVVSLGMVEAGASAAPTDYDHSTIASLYDFIIFTKPVSRKSDPCAAFKLDAGTQQP